MFIYLFNDARKSFFSSPYIGVAKYVYEKVRHRPGSISDLQRITRTSVHTAYAAP